MAKAKKSGKKQKKRLTAREAVTGLMVLVVVILIIVLLVWLTMPAPEQRGIPRKSRWWQQSWVEWPRISICWPSNSEDEPSRRIPTLKGALGHPFDAVAL
jgi:hypothetical protein